MIKTLRITGVLAVILAAVVLASVRGFLKPGALIHLSFGMRSDKQIDKMLAGPSAVDRFKEKHGGKAQSTESTTQPLIRQAVVFAGIINPIVEEPPQEPAKTSSVADRLSKVKPIGPVSAKFDLLGTCYSLDPKSSLAYIRLPDGACWVRQGSEVAGIVIKEIQNGSIVYWDGRRDVPMSVVPTPDAASLLEAGRAPSTPAVSEPGRITGGKASSSLITPSVAPKRAVLPRKPLPPLEISPEEQENLSALASRLKADPSNDPAARAAIANRLISEYRSMRAATEEIESPANLSEPAPSDKSDKDEDPWKNKGESRREYVKRTTTPRPVD